MRGGILDLDLRCRGWKCKFGVHWTTGDVVALSLLFLNGSYVVHGGGGGEFRHPPVLCGLDRWGLLPLLVRLSGGGGRRGRHRGASRAVRPPWGPRGGPAWLGFEPSPAAAPRGEISLPAGSPATPDGFRAVPAVA